MPVVGKAASERVAVAQYHSVLPVRTLRRPCENLSKSGRPTLVPSGVSWPTPMRRGGASLKMIKRQSSAPFFVRTQWGATQRCVRDDVDRQVEVAPFVIQGGRYLA